MDLEMGYCQTFFDKPVYISRQAEWIGADSVCRKVLHRVTKKDGNCKKIVFHEEMPAEAVAQIKQAFGEVYQENEEGYAVFLARQEIHVYALSRRGLLYGCYALLRMQKEGLREGILYNYPKIKDRGVKVFLPGEKNLEFFKQFVEYCSFYGCNTIIIETGGALAYDSHPEINEGWKEYCKIFDAYQGKSLDVQNAYGWRKNSIHFENGGGGVLAKEQVREIADFCKEYYMNVIPEVPSLSHSDYLLFCHQELAERQEDPLPNTYCPSNPAVYELLFDILEETIEVFRPDTIHIGHDEWYSIGLCKKCRGKNAADMYAEDIGRIYAFLKQRGIKTMLWGDKLLNAITKEGVHYGGSHIEYEDAKGNQYTIPATYPAIDQIPHDIIIMNWYWWIKKEFDQEFLQRNFPMLYGNFHPMQIFDYQERMEGKAGGYCISNWSSLDPVHIQRNGIFAAIAYAANMFWNHRFDEKAFRDNFIDAAEDIYWYHYEIMKPGRYIQVVHTTDEVREHKEFVDGYLMDYQKDFLGEYTVYYTDGSQTVHPVYFGWNIGCRRAEIGRFPEADSDRYALLPYFYEPAFTCAYVEKEDGLYYKMPIPVAEGRQVADIRLTTGNAQIKIDAIYGWNGKNEGYNK